jgi:hypothetical protein
MLKEDILIGAENWYIGVKGHIPERDGILNSLLRSDNRCRQTAVRNVG